MKFIKNIQCSNIDLKTVQMKLKRKFHICFASQSLFSILYKNYLDFSAEITPQQEKFGQNKHILEYQATSIPAPGTGFTKYFDESCSKLLGTIIN